MKKIILLLALMVMNFGLSQKQVFAIASTGYFTQDNSSIQVPVNLSQEILNSRPPSGGYTLAFAWAANNGNGQMNAQGGPSTPSATLSVIVNGIEVWRAISPSDSYHTSNQNVTLNGATFQVPFGGSGPWGMQLIANQLTNQGVINLPTSISSIQSIVVKGTTGGGGEGGDDLNLQMQTITIGNVITCLAGTSAPSLSSTSISNICPATTANLTSITASNKPVGTTISYHTSATASSTNKVTNPSAVASGMYYLAFEDSVNNCYSPTTAVVVTINPCLTDTDGDGIPDINDVDDDNDGILDTVESPDLICNPVNNRVYIS